MASPTVRGFAAATNSTDMAPAFAVTLPTRVAGDLLIAFIAADTTGTAITRTQTTEWAQVSEEAGGADRLGIFWRIATNDASDNLSVAGPNNNDGSCNIIAITTGTHGVTQTSDIVAPAAATGTDAAANPPTSGTVASQDWLALAIAVVDLTATGSTISAAPTNYTTGAILQKSASSTSSVALGVGPRALTAATSEDPGTFTNTSGAWIAKTLLIPPAGAADDWTQSPVEAIGVTDSGVGFDVELLRAEALGITDVTAMGRVSVVGDLVGITDAVVMARTIVVVDPVGITDTADVQKTGGATDWTQTPVDPVGITDSTALDRVLVVVDPVGITDTATEVNGKLITQTDLVGITDTAALTSVYIRTQVDPVGITDATAFDRTIVVVDPVGITDPNTVSLSGDDVVSQTDLVGITDSITSTAVFTRTQTDTVGITDITAMQRGLVFVDNIGIDDSSLGINYHIVAEDIIGIDDTVITTLGSDDTVNRVDNIGITDTVTSTGVFIRQQTDPIGITDAITKTQNLGRVDNIGITDSATTQLSGDDFVAQTDNVGITDSITQTKTIFLSFVDPIGITDTATRAISKVISFADAVGITDSSSRTIAQAADKNLCVVFGQPTLGHGNADLAITSHTSGAATLFSHTPGSATLVARAATIQLRSRSADNELADHDPGDLVLVGRSATIALGHGDAGEPTIEC